MLRRAPVVVLVSLAGACAVQNKDPSDLSIPNVEPTETGDAGTTQRFDSGGGGSAQDSASPRDSSTGGNDATSGTDSGGGGNDSGSGCATVPPNNLCGLVPQCGCGAGQTCDVTNDVSGATSCITAGATTQGGSCTGTGNCALGLTCVFGACRPYCTTPSQQCPGTGLGQCFQPQTAQMTTTPNRNVCAVTCDPRLPASTCGTNACYWFSGSVYDCRPGGPLGEFDLCTGAADQCGQGLGCVDYGFAAECERWCRLPAATYPGDCSGVSSCTDVIGPGGPTSGGAPLGFCE